ncbi:hypothetical protein GFS31_42270 (plasmid) [Leptolyngbya sp. BL0902]|uniref:DUF6515 family protein n=1 Tax=Leptolyngbya sp. BL0902 TaxID=1115757 RepID=UPI001936D44E|nr:DUF6515 family protein [Leptolyngbya sp. BL0902]QQE67514.1 hypothetical protein GFS31_42270 [Leptolyngbya sp. BL0902]
MQRQPMKFMILGTVALLAASTLADGMLNSRIVTQRAEAVVGRPATPVSAAGTSRRTTRRVIRRSTIYVASLPGNCSTVIIEGVSLYLCGGTYYEPYGNQYVVVYVE